MRRLAADADVHVHPEEREQEEPHGDRHDDRRYPLEDVVEATRHVETGQKTGNVVLLVIDPQPAGA